MNGSEIIQKNMIKMEIAKQGMVDELILNQALDNFDNRPNQNISSFDTSDFSLGFVRGLSFEDGAATLQIYQKRLDQS